jgi:HemY protein
MRILLWFIALCAVAIGLAVTAHMNPGNVVLFYPPYRVDISLNFFVILIVGLFIAFYVVMWTIGMARKLPSRVITYRREKREAEANKSLKEALKAFFEGRFGHAEKAAEKAAALPDNAGVAALIGARSAHRMRQAERRDIWLASTETNPALKTARLMTTLELSVDEHQFKRALEVVDELNANGTRHIQALQWALKANQQAKNWPEVLRLVQTLDKRKALHPALSTRLREMAYDSLLSDHAHDRESILRLWSSVPSEDRVNPFIASRAAKALNLRGLHDEARVLLERALNVNWDSTLLQAYRDSVVETGSPVLLGQIERCEGWIAKRANDPELILTLGVLCLRQKLWGKAQQHLQEALDMTIDPRLVRQGHLGLAQMHDALGQQEQAAEHYKRCALIA